nr:MAG TPA: Clip-domain serine protease-like protein [Caudoviricetes sp.]
MRHDTGVRGCARACACARDRNSKKPWPNGQG